MAEFRPRLSLNIIWYDYYRDLMATISIPQTKEISTVSLSEKATTYEGVSAVIEPNKAIAPVVSTVTDREFMEQNKGMWMFVGFHDAVDSKGNPLDADSWYRVNRENSSLEKINKHEAETLQWHERLYIDQSAPSAVHEKRPLALSVGDFYFCGYRHRNRLVLNGYYGYGRHGIARVVQLETKQDSIAEPKTMLRRFEEN